MNNLNGIFKLEIDGAERTLKYDFGAADRLENYVFKKPIMEVLNDILRNNSIKTTHAVDLILVGLERNNDTRFKRDDIGNEVIKNGVVQYIPFFTEVLTYLFCGDQKQEPEYISEEDKKK